MYRFVLGLSAMFVLVAPTVLPSVAHAQDIEDLDASKAKKSRKKDRKEVMAHLENEVIREIVRGFYLKAGAGGGAYIGRYTGILSNVMTTPLTFGQDFVDKEKQSMSWEVSVTQAVYNGADYRSQGSLPPQRRIEGDTRMFNFTAAYEYKAYPTRRLGIGVRAGGGVMIAPLLMEPTAYQRDVVQGTWGGQDSEANKRPHPEGFVGPTIEYYTKLSHFSIGADVDVMYQLDFDLNISGVGFFKYTF
jgi:hypothetical protein